MLSVKSEVSTYEVDGIDNTEKKIDIVSHWNRVEFVVIKIGKFRLTFSANELKKAIDNAINWE